MFMSARRTLRATRAPGFLAYPRHCPLEGERSRCEYTGSRTCSPVVAGGVEAIAAGARARSDWQRQAKPSQQQHAEEWGWHR